MVSAVQESPPVLSQSSPHHTVPGQSKDEDTDTSSWCTARTVTTVDRPSQQAKESGGNSLWRFIILMYNGTSV